MPVPYTAGSVMDLAASVYLNDARQKLYNYTVQLPYLKSATEDLDQQATLNGSPINIISEAVITLPEGDIALSLPESFFLPISLQEKGASDTFYSNMTEKPDVTTLDLEQSSTLGFWDFRHNDINFVGATEARTIRLVYWRFLDALVDEDSLVEISGAKNYLAAKTASKCALYIGNNQARATNIAIEAQGFLDTLESLWVKNNQGKRVRRKPFRRGVGTIHTARIP